MLCEPRCRLPKLIFLTCSGRRRTAFAHLLRLRFPQVQQGVAGEEYEVAEGGGGLPRLLGGEFLAEGLTVEAPELRDESGGTEH